MNSWIETLNVGKFVQQYVNLKCLGVCCYSFTFFLHQVLCSLCRVFRVDVGDVLKMVKRNEIQPITEQQTPPVQKAEDKLKVPSSRRSEQNAISKQKCASDDALKDTWSTNNHVCWRLLPTVLDRIFFIQQIVLVIIIALCLYPSLHIHRHYWTSNSQQLSVFDMFVGI